MPEAVAEGTRGTVEDFQENGTTAPAERQKSASPPEALGGGWAPQVFEGEWDEEGVYFYQAYNNEIADYAIANQRFGGPRFNPVRMTWIKPSFAWMLYRAGYGFKDRNQQRILKIKLPHATVADFLNQCECGHGGGGTEGRVQWDPARDLMSGNGTEPRKCSHRAIQIGLRGTLAEQYVQSAISIQDVTSLAHRVAAAHAEPDSKSAISALLADLPNERPYMPACSPDALVRLKMMQGDCS